MPSQYDTLEKAIISGDRESGVSEAGKLIEGGQDPVPLFTECIEPLLDDVGEIFSCLENFLPKMVNTSKAIKAVHKAIKPYFKNKEDAASKGKIIIATVSGDLHDIGKNIVKAMLEVNGYDVQDLDIEVSTQTIVKQTKEFDADIIALFALIKPSLTFVKDVVEYMEVNQKVKVIVGGGLLMDEENINDQLVTQGLARVVKKYDIKVSQDQIIN
ncbi:MAG: hypothetical protein DRI65_17540 [Chloroflexota bacterium]|nr:MAG: hypothetical protein DRI65_17540 [Chloroflexota bacterium]